VTFAGTVIGILLGLGVIHPFGNHSDPLGSVAAKVADAGSSRLNLDRVLTSADRSFPRQDAVGELDFRSGIGRLDFTNGVHVLLLNPYVYETGPSLPAGKWCTFDISVIGPGYFFGPMTGYRSDPAAAVLNLKKSKNYKKLGDEMLFGERTSHYAGKIDLTQLKVSSPELRQGLHAFAALNPSGLPVELWVTPDGVVRRLRESAAVPGALLGVAGKAHFSTTFDLSHFGVEVRPPQAPPAAKLLAPGNRKCPAVP
jgi:hypothetical protein